MSTLLKHRYHIREYLLTLIGLCLCVYFAYHAIHGERSIVRLWMVHQTQAHVGADYESLREKRVALESKVIDLRPKTLNKDLLEERARLVLGYKKPGELMVVSN